MKLSRVLLLLILANNFLVFMGIMGSVFLIPVFALGRNQEILGSVWASSLVPETFEDHSQQRIPSS